MDIPGDADHVMNDVGNFAIPDPNGLPATLDPTSLLLSTQDEPMSSPELTRDGSIMTNGLHYSKTDASQSTDGDLAARTLTKRESAGAPRFSPLPYASSRSGLVYDVRMRFHVEPTPKDSDMHPEDPRRIYEVYNELCQAGLVDDPNNPEVIDDYLLLRIPARHATEQEILACHSQKSFDFVMSLKGK